MNRQKKILMRLGRNLPVVFGFFLGAMAVCLEFFVGLSPPNSYGFCLSCHTRDMINWILNKAFFTHFPIQYASRELPLITTFLILIGAFFAAWKNKEFKLKRTSSCILKYVFGFLVMTLSLIAMGCPVRITLLTVFGDGMALFSFIGLLLGITIGSLLLKRRRWNR